MATTVKKFLSLILLAAVNVVAYVPAHPVNSSQEAIQGGLNATDVSMLHLSWFPNGTYSQSISYQLAGAGSRGIIKGALVHFSESKVSKTTPPTTTPWIALISCDFNSTNGSLEEDVFMLARDKGATAALLISLYSLSCVINPEYGQSFDQPFDTFLAQSQPSSRLIEYQFSEQTNKSAYGVYDSELLNKSASDIQTAIQQGAPAVAGYLFATLEAYNATGTVEDPTGNATNTGVSPASPSSGSLSNTALARIVLYPAMGCVSALFCFAIMSGVH